MPTIELSQGYTTQVDEADYAELSRYSWNANYSTSRRSWYAVRGAVVDGKRTTVVMARQILGLNQDDERQADHIDHDTLDNRRSNLRIATRKENCRNRRLRTDNLSSFKGVCWNPRVSKAGAWRAQIWIDGTNKHIGTFTDSVEAAKAYDRRALAEFGEFAYLNFPQQKVAA